MENLNPTTFWAWVLGIASAVVLISNAVEKIVKAWKAAKAPTDQQNERLDALERWKADVDRKLLNDNNHLNAIDEGTRITQRALLALLDHGIDGNNIAQMQHAKEELQEHLLRR